MKHTINTGVPINLGILTVLCLFTLLACRSSKEQRQQLSVQEQLQESTLRTTNRSRWQQDDSSRTYWKLYTDSILFFHPDIGLWSNGGRLEGHHMQQKHFNGQIEIDSAGRHLQKEIQFDAKNYLKDWNKRNGSTALWLTVIVTILIIGIWWRR